MNKTERRIAVLEAVLEDLEKEYNQALDELLENDTEANNSKERRLLQRINEAKKELEGLKAEVSVTDAEIEDIATLVIGGEVKEKQELTKSEENLFNSIADLM